MAVTTTRSDLSGADGFNSLRKDNETGTAAITSSAAIVKPTRLISVSCKFNAAPTTSENLTITANLASGAVYDVLLYSVDPSASSLTDLVWLPDEPMWFYDGDSIDIAYTNTDTEDYGIEIVMMESV